RVASVEVLKDFLAKAAAEAGVDRVLCIAGDTGAPAGPFTCVQDMLDTGAFEAAGLKRVYLAGHPDPHPDVSLDVLDRALAGKVAFRTRAGIEPRVVTQFCFSAETIMALLDRLQRVGVTTPVRIGVAGPADIKTLTTFAMRCGVTASLRILRKQTSLMGRLLGKGTAGPDKLLAA